MMHVTMDGRRHIDIDKYQEWTRNFDQEKTDWCLGLGLAGEAAEAIEKIGLATGMSGPVGRVVEKLKKKYRTVPLNPKPEDIAKELGDVLWYVARLAKLYGYTMTDIADLNVVKLESRARRGTLQGEGDNR